MPRWKYTIDIKDLMNSDEYRTKSENGETVIQDWDDIALKIAGKCAERCLALSKRVERVEGASSLLATELEEVADYFNDVIIPNSEQTPMALFNFALQVLYDYGDDGNRVWVN